MAVVSFVCSDFRFSVNETIMADSDDEYDKKIRDKFRGERDRGDSYKGIDSRREERRPPRDEWIERFVTIVASTHLRS